MEYLRPQGYDRDGPLFSEMKIILLVENLIKNNQFFYRRIKTVSEDFKRATDLCDQMIENLSRASDRLTQTEEKLAEKAKRASGKIRTTADALAAGLAKVEKQANFDRLERYVELLERAEKAMGSLAELESSGRLEKISAALR